MEKICYLTKMMEMQSKLNDNVITKLGMSHYDQSKQISHISDQDKRTWCDNFMSALLAEVVEIREALTSRVCWWKSKTKSDAGVKEEMVDALHFLMSGFLSMGMTAKEVFEIYQEKNKQNFERKDWDVNK